MKKLIVIALALALVATLSLGSMALAADPTEVDVTWDGAGAVDVDVAAGDDTTVDFFTGGSYIYGSLTVTDQNNNPYTYGVDTVNHYVQSLVENGYTNYTVIRNDSGGSYGAAGQVSQSYIYASGGTAEMAIGGFTNYAELEDPTYGDPKTTSGKNFEANANLYEIHRYLCTGDGDYAYFDAVGSGTALIDCMSSNAWSSWFNFARGSGCYTNADAQFTGSGFFDVYGEAGNQVSFHGLGVTSYGDGTAGSASLQFIANWTSSFSIADYSVSGN